MQLIEIANIFKEWLSQAKVSESLIRNVLLASLPSDEAIQKVRLPTQELEKFCFEFIKTITFPGEDIVASLGVIKSICDTLEIEKKSLIESTQEALIKLTEEKSNFFESSTSLFFLLCSKLTQN